MNAARIHVETTAAVKMELLTSFVNVATAGRVKLVIFVIAIATGIHVGTEEPALILAIALLAHARRGGKGLPAILAKLVLVYPVHAWTAERASTPQIDTVAFVVRASGALSAEKTRMIAQEPHAWMVALVWMVLIGFDAHVHLDSPVRTAG